MEYAALNLVRFSWFLINRRADEKSDSRSANPKYVASWDGQERTPQGTRRPRSVNEITRESPV